MAFCQPPSSLDIFLAYFVLCLSLYSVVSRYSSNMYIATDVNHLFTYAGNSLVMAIFTDILQ